MNVEASEYRVLIVDDEESMRDFLSIMLHREGYQVDTAVDGAQAVVHLRDHSYDLVISDIKMPGMSGERLLREIELLKPELKGRLLLTTGDTLGDGSSELVRRYGLEVLHKPFDLERLRRLVRDRLA